MAIQSESLYMEWKVIWEGGRLREGGGREGEGGKREGEGERRGRRDGRVGVGRGGDGSFVALRLFGMKDDIIAAHFASRK